LEAFNGGLRLVDVRQVNLLHRSMIGGGKNESRITITMSHTSTIENTEPGPCLV
jgi:hypothetical protein